MEPSKQDPWSSDNRVNGQVEQFWCSTLKVQVLKMKINTGDFMRYNYDLSEYGYHDFQQILGHKDDAKEFLEAIIEALYNKAPLPDLFESWLEELANYHGLKIPGGQLQIEKKNDTLRNIQFHLAKVLT